MTEFIQALLQHQFLQFALLAGLLASVGCGVIGSFVVVKRIAFLAGGVAHSVLGGMGMALYYGFNPMLGALLSALLAALIIGWIRLRWNTQEDTLIGAIWAIGMAVGMLFISKIPGYSTDLMSYLFGNILLVPERDLWFMFVLDLALLLIVTIFYKQFLAVVFDEEFARLRGVPVTFFYLLLLCLVALTVVLLVQVVGLILVIALLTIPAATAVHFVQTLGKMMVVATLLGSLFTSFGLGISYTPDLPAGPTIILLAGSVYVMVTVGARYFKGQKAKRMSRNLLRKAND